MNGKERNIVRLSAIINAKEHLILVENDDGDIHFAEFGSAPKEAHYHLPT